MKRIVSVLPLRGGSKGISNKNIRLFLDKPLFTWCAAAAFRSGLDLYISSEDEQILEFARVYTPWAHTIKRPMQLASDTASTESVLSHAIQQVNCSDMILLQATSPLTTEIHIGEAIGQYYANGCRPLVSGTYQHKFIWSKEGYPLNYDPSCRPRRQEWRGTFVENGALYIFSCDEFKMNRSRCPPPCTLYEMEDYHAIELDSIEDWRYLEIKAKELGYH